MCYKNLRTDFWGADMRSSIDLVPSKTTITHENKTKTSYLKTQEIV